MSADAVIWAQLRAQYWSEAARNCKAPLTATAAQRLSALLSARARQALGIV